MTPSIGPFLCIGCRQSHDAVVTTPLSVHCVVGALPGALDPVPDLEDVGGQAADRTGHILDGGGDDRGHFAHRLRYRLRGLLKGVLANLALAESVVHGTQCSTWQRAVRRP